MNVNTLTKKHPMRGMKCSYKKFCVFCHSPIATKSVETTKDDPRAALQGLVLALNRREMSFEDIANIVVKKYNQNFRYRKIGKEPFSYYNYDTDRRIISPQLETETVLNHIQKNFTLSNEAHSIRSWSFQTEMLERLRKEIKEDEQLDGRKVMLFNKTTEAREKVVSSILERRENNSKRIKLS